MVNVPASFQPLVNQAAAGTGIPATVVAVQAEHESGFNATARSSAGALGWLQFLPSTYDSNAGQAGVAPGTEFNPADETKVYIVFMKQLLAQFHGNLRNALAAYNAGPGNIQAGFGYADSILAEAKTGNITVSGSGSGATPATLTGITIPGLPTASGLITDAVNAVLKMLGLSTLKDLFERLGLIILGFALLLLGIHLLAGGGRKQPFNINVQESTNASGETTRTRKVKTPVASHTKTTKTAGTGAAKSAEKTGATQAVEAAAVA